MTKKGHDSMKELIAGHSILLFEQKGFSETSIQDITNSVGVTKGTFYYYYASKENLLMDIHLQYIYDLLEKQKAIMQTVKGFRRQLSEMVALIVYDMKCRRAHGQVYLREMRNLTAEHAETIEKKRKEFRLNATQVIADGIQAGEFQAHIDPDITCLAILGITNWSYEWFNPEGKLSVEELADQYIDLILYGIAAESSCRQFPKKEQP